jgi:hypothetical protein
LRAMSVEFLTSRRRTGCTPTRAELEKTFYLDDEDRALIARRRGDQMKLGFALQLVTVRHIGLFLEDPLDVPVVVLDFVAEQLGIEGASCVKRYTERSKTAFDHAWEIQRVYELKDFTQVEGELRRGWRPGRGRPGTAPRRSSLTRWRGCDRGVLLPGVTRLTRLVTHVKEETTQRLWKVLESLLTVGQRYVLEVPPGSRVSDLERWRKGRLGRSCG